MIVRVAASRPQALAMAASHPKKTIAKLRLTLPPITFTHQDKMRMSMDETPG